MLSPSGKLRQAVQSAGETIRQTAQDTGRGVILALAVAGVALLLSAAALILVLHSRRFRAD